jgi:predicted site-specific integrase-resolvase
MQELMEDSVEIVKLFDPRIYGQEYEKVIKCVEDVEKDS